VIVTAAATGGRETRVEMGIQEILLCVPISNCGSYIGKKIRKPVLIAGVHYCGPERPIS
jgi:hypothetical protein